jgi:hypothetical protein
MRVCPFSKFGLQACQLLRMPNGDRSRQLRNGNAKERLEEEENCKTCATERDIVGGASRWELRKLDVDAGWQSGALPIPSVCRAKTVLRVRAAGPTAWNELLVS